MRRKCRGGHQNRCENVGGSPKMVGRQKKARGGSNEAKI